MSRACGVPGPTGAAHTRLSRAHATSAGLHAIRRTPAGHALPARLCGRRKHARPAAGRYLEIFGRKNNLRDYWVTIGNEVTGKGLPASDASALRHGVMVPGAVYGRSNS